MTRKATPPHLMQSSRTMQQWIRDLRLGAAKQRHLFFRNRKGKFFWEQSLLAKAAANQNQSTGGFQ